MEAASTPSRPPAGVAAVGAILYVVAFLNMLAGVASLVQGYIGVGLVSILLPLFLMFLVFTPAAEAFFDS